MTTLNKTLEELTFEFSDINGILRDAFSSKEALTSSILNNQNKQAKLTKLANIDNPASGINAMKTKFAEAENDLLKKGSSAIASNLANAASKLAPYNNYLPVGTARTTDVNDELYAVGEKTWDNFSTYLGKIFQKVGKNEFEVMMSNASTVRPKDVQNMINSTCGSLSEWPQINPKSAGMGRCGKLFELFNRHYMGYSGGISEPEFYSDLISSLHTCEVYALSGKKKPTGINGFSTKIDAYNFNTSLWFLSDNEKIEATYNGFVREGKDSYGAFFDIEGFPVALQDYNDAIANLAVAANAGKLQLSVVNTCKARVLNLKKTNGTYMQISTHDEPTCIMNDLNIVIMKDIQINDGGPTVPPKNKKLSKIYCSLFLNEGNKADINKIEEIEKHMTYLFNIKKNGMFPAVCALPSISSATITTSESRKNDILLTQRVPEIGVMLFLRKIFEEIYPVATRTGGAAAANNETINIFAMAGNIVSNDGGGDEKLDNYMGPVAFAARRTMVHATDSLDNVKTKLKEKIKNYTSGLTAIYPEYMTTYIQPLIDMIDNITTTNLTWIANPIGGANVDPTTYHPFHFTTRYGNTGGLLIALFKAPIARPIFDFSDGNTNIFFTGGAGNNPLTVNNAPNARPSVQVYRHLMFLLIQTCWNTYAPTRVRANYNNLYNDHATAAHIITLTKARAQANHYNDLTAYKQAIPNINPIMTGGSSKPSSRHKIKTGGSKRKKIQKGGASDTLFTGAGAPKLYANRKLNDFNPDQFKKAVIEYNNLSFNTDYAKVKLLFNKISQIQYLPLFFDSYDDSLTIQAVESGGCGMVPPHPATVSLEFSDVAQLFLFNSVNTNTTTLLIHFFKNIKVCLQYFIANDLKTVADIQGKQIVDSQADKIEVSLRELIKELEKVINFLKYNTLNLQEQTINLNDFGVGATPNFAFTNNEHYVKNLFLGANVFFSYANTANQSVVMRLTENDGDATAAVDWKGKEFFHFLNKIVGCTQNTDTFSKTLKFLTDSNNQGGDTFGLSYYLKGAGIGNLTALQALVHNVYLKKISVFLKDKPTGCFGGIPFVSIDKKVFSSLMRSYYLLLGLRLLVGEELRKDNEVAEEQAFSELSPDKEKLIKERITNTLTVASFRTLAESLKKPETLPQATRMFNVIFEFLFIQSQRLIAEVIKADEETKKVSKTENKKKNLFSFTGGGPTSIYTYRPTTNANRQNNTAKKEVNFIKTMYQSIAEFNYMMKTIKKELKNEINRNQVRNQLHFYYYINTHFRNFKIYMETYLLTIGVKNIPPEMSQKLQQYIGYSPEKNKMKDTYLRLTTFPLIDPQYSDPLWWAKIESKFMDIEEIGGVNRDVVYRLFIITTTPANFKTKLAPRDLYIVDALALATLNDERSETVKWLSTGYRTHVGVKKTINSSKQKIYLDSNTAIKLTGIGTSPKGRLIKLNSMKSQIRTGASINTAVKNAIDEDIRDLIDGKYLYYDRQSKTYKKLIPLFLQADTTGLLNGIVNVQKDKMFVPYDNKFTLSSGKPFNIDYKIYQMEDKKIQDLKEFRQWLYQIFFEQQMKLTLPPEKNKFYEIETTMTASFKTMGFNTNHTGKCTRVYNIYDYIILHSLGNPLSTYRGKPATGPTPAVPAVVVPSIPLKSIKQSSSKIDMGAKIIAGFISREDLIKIMS